MTISKIEEDREKKIHVTCNY